MTPSRELDALVATKVMGWIELHEERVLSNFAHIVGRPPWYKGSHAEARGAFPSVPPYSSDIAAAWEVVEKLKTLGWNIALTNCCDAYAVWISKVWIDDLVLESDVKAPTAPLAICLAALKACGVEV